MTDNTPSSQDTPRIVLRFRSTFLWSAKPITQALYITEMTKTYFFLKAELWSSDWPKYKKPVMWLKAVHYQSTEYLCLGAS